MASRKQRGHLKTWKGDRGFGFIRPEQESEDIFLHISALPKGIREPRVGDTILYQVMMQPDGKLRAVNASIQGVALQSRPRETRRTQNKPAKSSYNLLRNSRISYAAGMGTLALIMLSGIWNAGRMPFLNQRFEEVATILPGNSAKSDCPIKGNISWNGDKKYYHLPGMEDYDKTEIDLGKGERWFCSEQEAQENGWVKAPTP